MFQLELKYNEIQKYMNNKNICLLKSHNFIKTQYCKNRYYIKIILFLTCYINNTCYVNNILNTHKSKEMVRKDYRNHV